VKARAVTTSNITNQCNQCPSPSDHLPPTGVEMKNKLLVTRNESEPTDDGRRHGLCFGLYGNGLASRLHGTPSPTELVLLRVVDTGAAAFERAGDEERRGGEDRMPNCDDDAEQDDD